MLAFTQVLCTWFFSSLLITSPSTLGRLREFYFSAQCSSIWIWFYFLGSSSLWCFSYINDYQIMEISFTVLLLRSSSTRDIVISFHLSAVVEAENLAIWLLHDILSWICIWVLLCKPDIWRSDRPSYHNYTVSSQLFSFINDSLLPSSQACVLLTMLNEWALKNSKLFMSQSIYKSWMMPSLRLNLTW